MKKKKKERERRTCRRRNVQRCMGLMLFDLFLFVFFCFVFLRLTLVYTCDHDEEFLVLSFFSLFLFKIFAKNMKICLISNTFNVVLTFFCEKQNSKPKTNP